MFVCLVWFVWFVGYLAKEDLLPCLLIAAIFARLCLLLPSPLECGGASEPSSSMSCLLPCRDSAVAPPLLSDFNFIRLSFIILSFRALFFFSALIWLTSSAHGVALFSSRYLRNSSGPTGGVAASRTALTKIESLDVYKKERKKGYHSGSKSCEYARICYDTVVLINVPAL